MPLDWLRVLLVLQTVVAVAVAAGSRRDAEKRVVMAGRPQKMIADHLGFDHLAGH